ncbi:damage-inducible type I toxin DinQ [Pantoea agglomerans]
MVLKAVIVLLELIRIFF